MNIALIGPRGVGKSKISRKLSKLTGNPALSTDMLAVYESDCMSIEEVIKKHDGSWKYFRDLEFKILEKVSIAKNIILDCGGGIIFDIDSNGKEILSVRKVNLLKTYFKIIYLSQKKEILLKKT